MKINYKTYSLINYSLLFMVLMAGFLYWSSLKDERLNTFADCIDERVQEDRFTGTLQEAWAVYAGNCS